MTSEQRPIGNKGASHSDTWVEALEVEEMVRAKSLGQKRAVVLRVQQGGHIG